MKEDENEGSSSSLTLNKPNRPLDDTLSPPNQEQGNKILGTPPSGGRPPIPSKASPKRPPAAVPPPLLDPSQSRSYVRRQNRTPQTSSRSGSFTLNMDVQSAAYNFKVEHRLFLKAILDLMAERDRFATEVGMNDPITIKSGPLKKASYLRGVWRVKYVEIRRGMLSYYDDDVSKETNREGELLRKNIPLHANSCICRAVKVHSKALSITPGFNAGEIFELLVDDGPKRYWMAKSREERQGWIQAITAAMVGGSVTRSDNQTDLHGKSGRVDAKSPYKIDLRQYLKMKNFLKNAGSKYEYIAALQGLLNVSLDVPVKWIMEQVGVLASDNADKAFHEDSVAFGITQLWKDLGRDAVQINDELFEGGSDQGPERIIGALSRAILAQDCGASTMSSRSKFDITESQALSYARDVLLSVSRTRSGGDSYYCVDTLCNNPDLVVCVPSSREAEPLSITVKSLEDRNGPLFFTEDDTSGWIRTRHKSPKSWSKRYFVLSEGTLSYYEQAVPRPHKLRGQLVLSNASISVSKTHLDSHFIVSITTKDKDKERQLLFDAEEEFIFWTYALEYTARASMSNSSRSIRNVFRRGSNEDAKIRERADDADVPSTIALKDEKTNNAILPELVPDPKPKGVFRLRSAPTTSSNKLKSVDEATPRRRSQAVSFGKTDEQLKLSFESNSAPIVMEPYDMPARETAEKVEESKDGGPTCVEEATAATGKEGKEHRGIFRRLSRSGDASSPSSTKQDDSNGNARPAGGAGVDAGSELSSILSDLNPAERALREHLKELGLNEETMKRRIALYTKRRASAVKISVHASTEYSICTTDPQGDERQDRWGTFRARFLQSFRVNGGSNGRIVRGEEIVQVSLMECPDLESVPAFGDNGKPLSPASRRSLAKGLRLFQSSSNDMLDR